MANYSNLIAAIQATIYNNGQNLITGSALQGVLIEMVQELGQAGAVFGGVVDRDFTPAATDSNIFYVASVPGTYSGFGQSVSVGEFAIFYFDGSDWAKATVTSAEVEVTPGSENGITLATINVGGQNYLIKAEVKDSTPTPNSTHPVESGGVSAAITAVASSTAAALALKADKTYVDNQLALKADKVAGAVNGNMAALDANGGIEDSEVPADNIAQQDGYYSTLIAGAAENLVGQDVQTAQFTRRVSGGSADVGTGAALIKSIKGNTLVWNQLVDTGTTSVTIPSGHKYYSIINGVRSLGTSTGAAIAVTGGTDSVFDLTQMYGAGNEPSTAAEFEALFPLNYYDNGTPFLLNNKAASLVTTGFNQWDEVWESGGLNSTTGATTSDSNRIRSKNFVPVFPSTAYYIKAPMTGLDLFEYDADKNYIGYTASVGNSARTTNAQTHYIKFRIGSSGTPVTTYKNNICINKSDPDKNGTYEPYEKHTLTLPITTMTGKINGEGASVVMLPNGARKAGTVFDETNGVKTWDRLLDVDLGTLTWQISGSGGSQEYAYTTGIATDVRYPANDNTAANIKCANYSTTIWNDIWGHTADNTIAVKNNGVLSIYSTALIGKTGPQVKAALSGVHLYAERATPIEYVNDTPLNLQYRVDNDGTETILPENTSTPTTAPFLADIQYAMNAVDTLRNLPKNYISKASMDSILTAFKTAGVITAYTLTWDATNQKYNCTITV